MFNLYLNNKPKYQLDWLIRLNNLSVQGFKQTNSIDPKTNNIYIFGVGSLHI